MENKDNLEAFLRNNGIEIIEDNKEIPFYNSPENHVENLIKFHRRVMKCEEAYDLAIKNNAGKDIVNYNLWNKRALLFKKELNIDNEIYDDILSRAKDSIDAINNSNYISLMERAVKRREIVLGNCSIKNIFYKENKIYIKDFEKIEFNTIESDCIKYILKEKKKKRCLNFPKIISLFLEGEGLSIESYNYIKGMISYPRETMRFISNCYVNDSKDLDFVIKNLIDLKKVDYIGIVREENLFENKI